VKIFTYMYILVLDSRYLIWSRCFLCFSTILFMLLYYTYFYIFSISICLPSSQSILLVPFTGVGTGPFKLQILAFKQVAIPNQTQYGIIMQPLNLSILKNKTPMLTTTKSNAKITKNPFLAWCNPKNIGVQIQFKNKFTV